MRNTYFSTYSIAIAVAVVCLIISYQLKQPPLPEPTKVEQQAEKQDQTNQSTQYSLVSTRKDEIAIDQHKYKVGIERYNYEVYDRIPSENYDDLVGFEKYVYVLSRVFSGFSVPIILFVVSTMGVIIRYGLYRLPLRKILNVRALQAIALSTIFIGALVASASLFLMAATYFVVGLHYLGIDSMANGAMESTVTYVMQMLVSFLIAYMFTPLVDYCHMPE